MKGAHTIPEKSPQLPRRKHPDSFGGRNVTGKQSDGRVYSHRQQGQRTRRLEMDDLTLALGGPTTDYSFSAREDATKAVPGISAYTYKFNAAIPAGGKGTFVVGGRSVSRHRSAKSRR